MTSSARDLTVFSTIAVQPALQELAPAFEAVNACRLVVSWNTAPVLVKRLRAGGTADVLILNRAGIDAMTADGRLLPDSTATLASSTTMLAVRQGAPRPDISTVAALTRTLLDCRAISYTDPAAGGASGIHFAKVLERLGIAREVNARNRFPPPAGLAGELLARGEVDLAVQQKPELLQVPGLDLLGPLPGDLHMVTVFVAGVEASSRQAELGGRLIDFLRQPAAAAVFRARGLDPGEPA